MIKVLTITGILPIPEIETKKFENDIIIRTEEEILHIHNDICFEYFYILPFTNRLLSNLSSKWKSYFHLQNKREYYIGVKRIFVLGIIMLPKSFRFRNLLYELSFILNRKFIHQVIKTYAPTIIHAQNSDSDAYLAKIIKRKYGIPYVVTVRGINTLTDSIVASNLDNAKELIALSPIQKEASSSLSKVKTSYVPHGVRPEFFSKSNYKLDQGNLRFVTVSRLLGLKNLDKVINTLSKFGDNYIYDIYGDGPKKECLNKLIDDLGLADKVRLKGFVHHSELPNILPTYNLFIMPSFPETLGRVYFEAMASGLPVIASKGTGIDGIITEGKEGFLVNPKDEVALEDVLSYVFKYPHKLADMHRHAISLAKEFKWEFIASKLYGIYSS